MPIAAEVINTDPSVVDVGRDILITGYGCNLKNGMPEVGTMFSIGTMKVRETSYLGTDLILAQSNKGTTLCEGDSGGGTLLRRTTTVLNRSELRLKTLAIP